MSCLAWSLEIRILPSKYSRNFWEKKHKIIIVIINPIWQVNIPVCIFSHWSKTALSPAGWPVVWPDSVCSSIHLRHWTWPIQRRDCGWNSERHRSPLAPSCLVRLSELHPKSSSPDRCRTDRGWTDTKTSLFALFTAYAKFICKCSKCKQVILFCLYINKSVSVCV